MSYLELKNISFKYKEDYLFKNQSFIFDDHKINIILGDSGIGKTTLLRLFAGLITPENGEVNYCGSQLNTEYKRFILSYLDQDGHCFENMTIIEYFKQISQLINLEFDYNKMIDCLNKVNLGYLNLKTYPQSLSGGERKRFLLSISIYKDSKVILLDEPTSALDDIQCQQFINIVKELHQQKKLILIVTHDLRLKDQSFRICTVEHQKIIGETGYKNDENLFLYSFKEMIHPICTECLSKRQKILSVLLIIIGTLMIGNISQTILSNYQMSNKINTNLRNSLVNEIHFRKVIFDTKIIDGFRAYDCSNIYDSHLERLSVQDLNTIKNIKGVSSLSKYYCINNDEVENKTYTLNNNSYYIDTSVQMFSSNQYDLKNDEVYISQSFADLLGIEDYPINMSINMTLPVAQYYSEGEVTYSKYDEKTKTTYPYMTVNLNECNVITQSKNINLNIKGVIDSDDQYAYFLSSETFIAGNEEYLEELIDQNSENYISKHQSYEGHNLEKFDCADYILYVDDLNQLNYIDQEISKLDSLYDVSCQYLNANEINETIKMTHTQNFVNSIIILIIGIVVFIMIFINFLRNKKNEINDLLLYGFTFKEIKHLLNIEFLEYALLWSIFNFIYIFLFKNEYNFYIHFLMKGNQLLITLMMIIISIILLIFIGYSISCLFILRGYQNDQV